MTVRDIGEDLLEEDAYGDLRETVLIGEVTVGQAIAAILDLEILDEVLETNLLQQFTRLCYKELMPQFLTGKATIQKRRFQDRMASEVAVYSGSIDAAPGLPLQILIATDMVSIRIVGIQ